MLENEITKKYNEAISDVNQAEEEYNLSKEITSEIKSQISANKYKLGEANVDEIKPFLEPLYYQLLLKEI